MASETEAGVTTAGADARRLSGLPVGGGKTRAGTGGRHPSRWGEVKSQRGRPKTHDSNGQACVDPRCVYYQDMDAESHALRWVLMSGSVDNSPVPLSGPLQSGRSTPAGPNMPTGVRCLSKRSDYKLVLAVFSSRFQAFGTPFGFIRHFRSGVPCFICASWRENNLPKMTSAAVALVLQPQLALTANVWSPLLVARTLHKLIHTHQRLPCPLFFLGSRMTIVIQIIGYVQAVLAKDDPGSPRLPVVLAGVIGDGHVIHQVPISVKGGQVNVQVDREKAGSAPRLVSVYAR